MIEMNKFKVLLSPAAQSDFLGVIENLDTLPQEATAEYYTQFITKMEILRKSPESCPFARDSQLRLRGYRTLSNDGYLVFFIINDNTVEIRRILYANRQYDRLG